MFAVIRARIHVWGSTIMAQTGLAESSLRALETKSVYTRTVIPQVDIDVVNPAQSEQWLKIISWFSLASHTQQAKQQEPSARYANQHKFGQTARKERDA